MECLECKNELWQFANWYDWGTDVTCPECGKVQHVNGEESYDEETGEENEWFWTEEVQPIN